MSTHYDAAASPALVEVMRAAGSHDLDAALAGLDLAESSLRRGPHKARADIARARNAAAAGEWRTCWMAAHQAICGLTHIFPPDLSLCPPVPENLPFTGPRTCTCGVETSPAAKFCPVCGSALATT